MAAAPQGRPRISKLDAVSKFLKAEIEATPDKTMPELAAGLFKEHGVRATPAMLSRHLIHRLGYPDLHIYHYAPYEPSALKRLMGRYGTRENEIDDFLRSDLLVDLYSVVRNGLRAGVESYSIKKLEPMYGFERDTSLPDAKTPLTSHVHATYCTSYSTKAAMS